MSNLTITIAGGAGQGKTSTAFMIAELLTDNGFIVDYEAPDFDNIVEYDQFKKHLPMDGAGKIVEIKEVQMHRKGAFDNYELHDYQREAMERLLGAPSPKQFKELYEGNFTTGQPIDASSPAAKRALVEAAINDMHLDRYGASRSYLDSMNFANTRISALSLEDHDKEMKFTLSGVELETKWHSPMHSMGIVGATVA